MSLALAAGPTVLSEAIEEASANASSASPIAIVGMPFMGKWAWNALVNPDANGQYNDITSSHPSVHARYGSNWATDVYANSGTAVKLHVTSPDGPVTYSFNQNSDTCSSVGPNIAGHGIKLNVMVKGILVGTVKYDHLDNIPSSNTSFTDGMTIGTVTNEPTDPGCYSTYHTHIELTNTGSNYACWDDEGRPGEFVLSEGTAIGELGSTNTGPQQKCGDVGTASSAGRLVFMNSLNAAYAKDEITPGGWHRLTGDGDAQQVNASGTHVVLVNGGGQAYGADISAANLSNSSPGLLPLSVPLDPNTPGGVKKVVTDDKGNMMAINNCSAAYGWRNIAGSGNQQWVQMTSCGDAKDVTVGNGRLGLISSCSGAYDSDTGYAWTPVLPCNDVKAFAVGETGRLMVIDASNSAYIYNPGQNAWILKGAVGDATKIAIGKDRVMLVTNGGAAWGADIGQDNSAAMTRLTVDGDATAIAVGANDRMAIISGGGEAYASDTIVYGGAWTPESGAGDAHAIAMG